MCASKRQIDDVKGRSVHFPRITSIVVNTFLFKVFKVGVATLEFDLQGAALSWQASLGHIMGH